MRIKSKKQIEKDSASVMVEGATHEEALAEQEVAVGESKHVKKLTIASTVWSLISTAYAIVSTSMFLKSGWVEHELSYVLIVMLAVFVAIFIGLVVLSLKKPEKAKISIKTYKTLLKLFKSFANVAFLVLSAVSMAGIASDGMSLIKWVMFGVTFFVAVVQLGLKLAMLMLKSIRHSIAKRYKVKIHNFKNGKKQKSTLRDKLNERTYK